MEPFRHPPLDEASAPADPMLLFTGWLDDVIAAALPEPTAMVLATASASGFPRARTVLLKEHSPAGFVFYTNRTSIKGQHLAARPQACLLFPWYPMQRQVIVRAASPCCRPARASPTSTPGGTGHGSARGPAGQFSVLASRAELDERYHQLEQRWPEGTQVPMPDFWGGYRVRPDSMEFWQGRVNRMHDRLRYRRDGQHWVRERLAP